MRRGSAREWKIGVLGTGFGIWKDERVSRGRRDGSAGVPPNDAEARRALGRLGGKIERLNFDATNRPISFISHLIAEGDIDLSPAYQRGSVWTEDQRLSLVRSLLEGVPIGIIFLNHREISEPYRVVDGKQRIETLRDFLDGTLRVPASWFDDQRIEGTPDAQGLIAFSDLTASEQSHIRLSATIAVYETRFPSEEHERDLFDRINFTGTPITEHGPQGSGAGFGERGYQDLDTTLF